MCLIIANLPEGKEIEKAIFKTATNNNNDGTGIAHVVNRKLIVRKFVKKESVDIVHDYYREIRGKNVPVLIHFRLATHGVVNDKNTHPFLVHDKLVVAHNGIMNNVPCPDNSCSDTYHFVKDYLQVFPPNFYKLHAYHELMASFIGTGNKLCFLDARGDFYIVNEKAGSWKGGNWYSNTYSLIEKQSSYYGIDDADGWSGYSYKGKGSNGGKVYQPAKQSALTFSNNGNEFFNDLKRYGTLPARYAAHEKDCVVISRSGCGFIPLPSPYKTADNGKWNVYLSTDCGSTKRMKPDGKKLTHTAQLFSYDIQSSYFSAISGTALDSLLSSYGVDDVSQVVNKLGGLGKYVRSVDLSKPVGKAYHRYFEETDSIF